MSAVPKREPVPTRSARPETGLLVSALVAESASLAKLQERDRWLERVRSEGVGEFRFIWHAWDDHQLDLRVYVSRDELPEIQAARLELFDGRSPTASERVRWETAFDEEMLARGDLWLEVTSYLN